MARRIQLYPNDEITAGTRIYLQSRYSPADVEDRRQRLALTIKRVVRRGASAEAVHRALRVGINAWFQHEQTEAENRMTRDVVARFARAHAALDKAIESVQRALRPEWMPSTSMPIEFDALLELRALFAPFPKLVARRRAKPGKPWAHRTRCDEALRRAGVGGPDRRELLAALGFIQENRFLAPRITDPL